MGFGRILPFQNCSIISMLLVSAVFTNTGAKSFKSKAFFSATSCATASAFLINQNAFQQQHSRRRPFPSCPKTSNAFASSKTKTTTSILGQVDSKLLMTPVSSETMSVTTKRMQEAAETEMKNLVQFYELSKTSSNCLDIPGSSQTSPPRLLASPQEVFDYIDQEIDVLLFDCDGVVYRSPDPAPGALACLQSLLNRQKQIFFVTNNAGSNRIQLKQKLDNILQVKNDLLLTEEMMISSSYSCAHYLQRILLDKKGSGTLFVIGSQGLCDELRGSGFTVFGGPSSALDDSSPTMTRDELAAHNFDQYTSIDAVVVGHDTELTFRKLCIANVLLQRHPSAKLIATNRDSFDLVGVDARHIVGNGCIVAALEYSSKRTAINCGKSSPILAELIARQVQATSGVLWDPSRTLMVGDRLDTDVLFGRQFGMQSALVFTGVTLADKIETLINEGENADELLPSVIFPHVGYMT